MKLARKEPSELNEMETQQLYDLKLIYPLYGLKTALHKLHKGMEPTQDEMDIVARFVDSFSSVSLHPAIVGPIVAGIAEKVNKHQHTKTCRKYNTVCRFNMPKLPSFQTLIAKPLKNNTAEAPEKTAAVKKAVETKHSAVIKIVKEVLNDKEAIHEILNTYPKINEKTLEDAKKGRTKRINAVLDRAGLKTDDDKQRYQDALQYSSSGYTVVMERDIDETMVNSYNPEITRAWDGNTDFQICLDFYAIITYITEYYVKDDTGIVKHLVNTLKGSESDDLKEKMKLLMNTWVMNRQMGEAEAVYRLTKEFHFRDSDAKCVFLNTNPRSERFKILKNVTGKTGYDNIPKVYVNFHNEGSYIEQYDLNSKYERRPTEEIWILKHLSLSQMVKMYDAFWGRKMEKDQDEDDEGLNDDISNKDIFQEEKGEGIMPTMFHGSKQTLDTGCLQDQSFGFMPNQTTGFMPNKSSALKDTEDEEEELLYASSTDDQYQRVMAYGWEQGKGPLLPKIFRLINPYPGEPPFMKLRTKPAVLRFHKFKAENDLDAYWFSEAMLYLPYTCEENLLQQLDEAKTGGEEKWEQFIKQITYVKAQVMPYLEDTEQARMMAEMAEQIIDYTMIGELMDPEGEQERDENRTDIESIMQLDEFSHLDPEYVEPPLEDLFEKAYRPIEVRPLEDLCTSARMLDFYQRKVLEIGVNHARRLVKSRKGKNSAPKAPLCMVDGAAGSGKSCTINILKEFLQLIMQQPGDNPECPHVMLCAPTGTAAVNIKGQTLHSAFSFTFGDEHYSLSDKTRDTKRTIFKNLRFLIIDEISMVKADQLYQLDLRLRELTMRSKNIFGGVALFLFGDIMQLKPVMGRYIWSQPASKEYLHAFLVQSHWDQFKVISLVENHRQQRDAIYADILNRIRIGEHTDEDLNLLHGRVRPEAHPDLKGALVIASTHTVVNKHNDICLEILPTELLQIEAINSHNNIPNYIPKLHKKKHTVGPTPYLQTLKIKVGCRVMLTSNLDVKDCLCNGSIGTLQATIRDKKGIIKLLMVKFDDEYAGRDLRGCHPQLAQSFQGCTPISKQLHKYSTSKSSKGVKANVATVYQFPLILCFASTTHKIQGATILAPRKVAMDLTSVFGPNQAYVMLGRIQSLEQLYIIKSLPENKIITDSEAKGQLEVLQAKSINNNPPIWEKDLNQGVKVLFHNIHSLRDKIDDVRADLLLPFADLAIFSETWLSPEVDREDLSLHLKNTSVHFNSQGRGKGLAVYIRDKRFNIVKDINTECLQMTLLQNHYCYVLGLYRSQQDKTLSLKLKEIVPSSGTCLIIGDFNLCSKRMLNHQVFLTLKALGFSQIIDEATHIEGGHLDQAWLRSEKESCSIEIYSPYYNCKDHDALLCTIYDPSTEKGEILLSKYKFSNNVVLGVKKQSWYGRFQECPRARNIKSEYYRGYDQSLKLFYRKR